MHEVSRGPWKGALEDKRVAGGRKGREKNFPDEGSFAWRANQRFFAKKETEKN